ncbi:type II toxin-antitoxin system RelE/ParE family toxin [Nostoc sp. NMS1]|uniref:type II toxin-antitoxin system RelE/ParE family toxin n=1 Tax=Nostoc sp. NMS1 TaxID=2815388 RepID=UPI0025E33BBD|nr:type II toxin-antitoxin system RelE/ParE family toxin [Nostoc sp. NMS1]
MSSYSFSDEAIQDLDEICEYIARSNPKAASKLFDDIRNKCKLVAGFPNMGKSYGRLVLNLRGFIVDDYNYILLSQRGWNSCGSCCQWL